MPYRFDENIIHPLTGCRHGSLYGLWMIDPAMLTRYADLIEQIGLDTLVGMRTESGKDAAAQNQVPYQLQDGVAIFNINGPTTKHPTSFQSMFGGTSTVQMSRALVKAMHDSKVKQGLIRIDSPGGTFAGMTEFGAALRKFGDVKPLHTFGDDHLTSAAYWTGVQGARLTAAASTMVGSIGTKAVLYDTSERAKEAKVKVIPITTGTFKAAGEPGTEITQEQIEYYKDLIGQANKLFVSSVQSRRNLPAEKMAQIASEAKVYGAEEAQKLGLIDGIETFEQSLEHMLRQRGPSRSQVSFTKGVATMPLSNNVLTKLRSLPNMATASEDVEVSEVVSVASDLHNTVQTQKQQIEQMNTELTTLRQRPAVPPMEMLQGHFSLASERVDMLVTQGKILPVQAAALKTCFGTQEKPNHLLMMPDASGQPTYKGILASFDENKPNGLAQPATGAQPTKREAPGTETGADGKPSPERLKQLQEAYQTSQASVNGAAAAAAAAR